MNKNMNLYECLNTLNEEQIDMLYQEHIDNPKQKKVSLDEKKQILSEAIPQIYKSVCITFTTEEEKQIEDIINGKKIKNVSPRLLELSFIFEVSVDNKIKYIVPDEIIDAYKSTTTPTMKKEKAKMVISFYLEVNGAIHLDKLCELVKETGIDLTKKKIIEYIEEDDFILENNIVYCSLLPKELNIYNLNKNNEYRQYYIEEIFLIKIEEFEDKHEEKLSKILSKYTKNNSNAALSIKNMITVGYDFDDVIKNYLNQENIKFNKKDQEKFDLLVQEIYLKTPSWEFNGHIPTEILNNEPENYEHMEKLEYIHAYMLINGVMEIDIMLDLFKNEHNITMTKKELKDIISVTDDLTILNDFVVVKGVTKDILTVLKMSKNLHPTYKIIENVDDIFEEDKENISALEEICNKYHLKDEIKESIFSMMNFGSFNESLLDGILNSFNIKLNNDKKQNLFKKLDSLYKNVRLWTLNGFKKSEMNIRNKSNKIGRNDKCICGSGKKYKHCCGK